MEVAERTQARWAAFAHEGQADWPAYEHGRRSTLLIDRTDVVVEDLDRAMRTVWGEDVVGFS